MGFRENKESASIGGKKSKRSKASSTVIIEKLGPKIIENGIQSMKLQYVMDAGVLESVKTAMTKKISR